MIQFRHLISHPSSLIQSGPILCDSSASNPIVSASENSKNIELNLLSARGKCYDVAINLQCVNNLRNVHICKHKNNGERNKIRGEVKEENLI